MKEFLLVFGILMLWIVLNRWVLPWFGVPTCMSGGCRSAACPTYVAEPGETPSNDVVKPKGNQP